MPIKPSKARSPEAIAKSRLVNAVWRWWKFSDRRLSDEQHKVTNIGLMRAVENHCAELQALRDREREVKRKGD